MSGIYDDREAVLGMVLFEEVKLSTSYYVLRIPQGYIYSLYDGTTTTGTVFVPNDTSEEDYL